VQNDKAYLAGEIAI